MFFDVVSFLSMHTGYYLTKASTNPGAGDVLMGFLGSVILSFAFSMFKQRKVATHSFIIQLQDFSHFDSCCFNRFIS